MTESSRKEQTLTTNFAAFQKMLPDLVKSHAGEYALIRDEKLTGFYDTASAAHVAGRSNFDDGLFSVQKIEEGAISLGYFSYARYCRAA